MLTNFTSRPVFRIAPVGCTPVFLNRVLPSEHEALVSSRIGTSGWAKRPMVVFTADLFETRDEAVAEYRARRAAALARNPNADLNLTTQAAP